MPFSPKSDMTNLTKLSTEKGYWIGKWGEEVQIINSSGAFIGTLPDVILDGGNSEGAAITIGTNDNFAVNFETNGTVAGSINTSQAWTLGVDGGSQDHFSLGNSHRFQGYIGKTVNSSSLVVTGSTSAVAGGAIQLFGNTASTPNIISLITANTERARVTATGAFQVVSQGTAATPVISRTDDTDTGIYFSAANTLDISTGGSRAVTISSSGACVFGKTGASTVAHAFYKDVNAGDTTTSVQVAFGNSGSNQGLGRLFFTNAAATGTPRAGLQTFFRNNGNTTLIDGGLLRWSKASGADNASFEISLADTAGTGRIQFTMDYNSSTRLDYILNGAGTANLDSVIRRGSTSGSLQLSSSTSTPSASGAGIALYANNHSTLPNITYFYNAATLTGIIDASGKWTIGASGGTQTHALNINTSTTVGAAGGASALPANPTGYIVVNINGTDRKIPFYAT